MQTFSSKAYTERRINEEGKRRAISCSGGGSTFWLDIARPRSLCINMTILRINAFFDTGTGILRFEKLFSTMDCTIELVSGEANFGATEADLLQSAVSSFWLRACERGIVMPCHSHAQLPYVPVIACMYGSA